MVCYTVFSIPDILGYFESMKDYSIRDVWKVLFEMVSYIYSYN